MRYLQMLPRYPSALHMLIHELLQVIVQELKHKEELAVTVEHLQEADDVGMVQLLEQGDLSNGRGWDTFTFTAEERKTLPEWNTAITTVLTVVFWWSIPLPSHCSTVPRASTLYCTM